MTDTATPIAVTAAAAARIKFVVSTVLDVGGISVKRRLLGLSYGFRLTTAREDDDFVIERSGATRGDRPRFSRISGRLRLDFVDDLMGQAFKMKNPYTANLRLRPLSPCEVV